jgi:hypothetical protein
MTTTEALRAVDDALASGRPLAADPVERELQEIALALRADAPAPDPAFASGLDERVAARFAKAERARRRWLRPPPRRAILAGAAGVVVVVAVAGALVGVLDRGRSGSSPGRPMPLDTGASQGTAAAPMPSPPPGVRAAPFSNPQTTAATAPPGAPAARRVERDAQLTLAAPADRLDEVANAVVQVTDRHRGVVLDSSLSTGNDSSRGGSFSLRVPTAELSQTLRDLSRLGEVRARSQSGHDVTGPYNRLGDRLAAARLERRSLMRRLAHATSTAEADRIRSRLDELSLEIQTLNGNLGDIRSRTDFTPVSVTLVEQRHHRGALGGAGDALRGSLRALVGAAAVALRIVAAVLPFLLLAALAWAATAAVRRRRREAILS